ncbi:hypothetical protein PsorP6_015220 [Peronosclerospora sorghi]|uniref:Uncharacterized protein n=1 Tax=Peronosclerospora sorghi TaxID=230839 RepID=A0ACC0VTK0_9STRA|nr:hypothetical protein PsorP6_015220 [Peronosclerospora sorghi]
MELGFVFPNETAFRDITTLQMKLARANANMMVRRVFDIVLVAPATLALHRAMIPYERLVLAYCKSLDPCCPLPRVDDVPSGRILFTLYEMLTHVSRKGVDECGWLELVHHLKRSSAIQTREFAWSHVMTKIVQNCMSVVTSRRCHVNDRKEEEEYLFQNNHLDVLVELFDAAGSESMGASSVRTVIEVPSHILSRLLCTPTTYAAAAVLPRDDDCTQSFSCVPSSVARRMDVTASARDESYVVSWRRFMRSKLPSTSRKVR